MALNIEIRQARKEDLNEVAELYADVFNEASPYEHWTKDSALALFEYWMERQPDLFFVAEDTGKIIGGVAFNIKPWFDGKRFQDGELFVHKDYRKMSVGTELFIVTLEKAIEKYGVTRIEAITFSQKGFPLNWYEKLGLKKENSLAVITGDCKLLLENLKKSRKIIK